MLMTLRRRTPTNAAIWRAGADPADTLCRQLLGFGVVGAIGFLVDSAALYLLIASTGLGPYAARLPSYLLAATATWALNRRVTFPNRRGGNAIRQWMEFVLVNAIGGVVNYAVYATLIAAGGVTAAHPVLAVACGSVAGLALNFASSRRLVFRV